jgi:mono/diheme cytochrome c family protein
MKSTAVRSNKLLMLQQRHRRFIGVLALLAALGLIGFWLVTEPRPLLAAVLPQHTGDVVNGERLYHAGGCHSCHKIDPKLSGIDAKLPAGGTAFKTPIGIFYPPNLTPDAETGLGKWSDVEFVNAMQRGIGREGSHLIPAFPYTSYAKMKTEEVIDIRAYLASLPAVKNQVPEPNVLALPLVRRGMGAWKIIGFDDTKFAPDPQQSESWNRGAELVNGPGHCNECHTPRTIFMTSDSSRFLAGGPHPDGAGKVPSLRDLVGRGRYKDAADLVSALQFGETMGYDKLSSGGMGSVQTNLSKLPEADLQAIAEYLISQK